MSQRRGCLTTFVGTRTGERPPVRVECDRERCRKPAAEYVLFAWGAAALCRKHVDEDAAKEGP